MNEAQKELLESLGFPVSFAGLDDNELIRIEETLADELQMRGINETGNSLNEYGELCRSIIVSTPDD